MEEKNIAELVDEVYSCLSQPAATEIGHFLLIKQKDKAKKLLKREEGHWLNDEQLDLFIEHEFKNLNVKNMTVKEIAKSEVIETPLDEFEKAPNYLVRIGTMVFVAQCIVIRAKKGGQFMAPNRCQYSLSEVDQVFEIKLT